MMRAPLESSCAMLAALAIVIVSGCTGGNDQNAMPAPSPEPSVTTGSTLREPSPEVDHATEDSSAADENRSATDRADAAEEAVLNAYQGYWDAIIEANSPPDPTHPALKRYATGEAYESVFEAAQTNRVANRALRLPEDARYEHRAEVVSIEGDTATVRDCSIDDLLVVNTETGEVVNDEVVTRLSTGTLVRENGTWKVADSEVERTWEGVAGCAVE